MTTDAVVTTYALAPDVTVDPGEGGAFLVTATTRTWIDCGELETLQLLTGGSEISEGDAATDTNCAALLYRLDHLGLLVRVLSSRGRRLTACLPLRPPPEVPSARPPDGPLRFSPRALARVEANVVVLEAPGAWARMTVHDRDLLPLLHDLAIGRPAAAIAAAEIGHSEDAILAVLAMMSWCGLLDRADDEGWSCHDLLFHARTRRGYARVLLGKTESEERSAAPEREPLWAGGRRVPLEMPDLSRLLTKDPPHALVSERRHSIRRQGSHPLTSRQLSEFLFRTLHQRDGRRPYPSGGSCYPLQAYLAVHRCNGLAPGLYAYDPTLHDLAVVDKPGRGLDELLAEAAAAANIAETPHILLVLAARYERTRRVYSDLSYSLILKEVGAVFQTALMAAAAMGVGACPLGCGNSLLFANLARVNPLTECSVGEMIVGSLADRL
jgi:oxazoline/thiazoline dehydrogenase